ncbi:MAG TPA: tetratricopeptide repeat protein, partial [Candidatus Cloacimonetes bacterium]|nr:tetratricopeptide repeat protein [Candidatus Cloacimonadota bacterium]
MDHTNQERKIIKIMVLLDRAVSLEELGQIIKVDKDFLVELDRIEFVKSEIENEKIIYEIAHDLIGETIEEQLVDDEKKELHQLIAQRVEEIHTEELDSYVMELARHYFYTDNREKAIEYLEKAGDTAKASYNNQQAIEFYDKLLNLLSETEVEKRIDMMLRKGDVLQLIGKWKECIDTRKISLVLSEKNNDQFRMAKSYQQLGLIYLQKGNYDEAMKYFE